MALYFTGLEICVALQGVFIGAEGVRVRTQVVHKSRCPGLSELPWKCGICRGIAAFWWQIATRFGAWLLLVRQSGRLLLEAASWLFIMGFGYNLGIKLSRFQISQYLYPRISLSLHSYLWLLSSSCKCLGLDRSLSFPLL